MEKNEVGGACSTHWENIGVYRVLVGKPEWNKPLGRSRRRWEENIKIDLQEVGSNVMDWIDVAEDRDRWRTLVNAVMNLRVPWSAGNFLTSWEPISFSRRTLLYGVSMRFEIFLIMTPYRRIGWRLPNGQKKHLAIILIVREEGGSNSLRNIFSCLLECSVP